MRIGHIDDADILKNIELFRRYCGCPRARLRKLAPTDRKEHKLIYIEFSLACQGVCAMCCVDAPSWSGHYDYYNSLSRLIEACRPKNLLVQGGEVLIQKKTLKWLYGVRERYPSLKISLVTNGCVSLDLIETVEDLFEVVTVSMVGFEPETYRKIMGLDMHKTIAFAEKLARRNRIRVWLKYLVTPLNLHETNLFLKWAIEEAPERISVCDANTATYIKETEDRFWQKIIERTSSDIKSELVLNGPKMKGTGTIVGFDFLTRKMFGIDEEFVKINGMDSVIDLTNEAVFFVDKGIKDDYRKNQI